MNIREFSASGKILLEVTDQTGDDADFGMSGILSTPDYKTEPFSIGRIWLDNDEVREVVVSGFAPAPGQEVWLGGMFPSPYLQVVEGNFWITDGGSQTFSMPIPQYIPSGEDFAGIWTVRYDSNVASFRVKASVDAYDFSQLNYIVHGVVRFVNV